jgi:uncharacterized membrane protein
VAFELKLRQANEDGTSAALLHVRTLESWLSIPLPASFSSLCPRIKLIPPSTLTMDCTPLSSRTSFESYTPLLQPNATLDLSLVSHCRAEICSALWGSGNPDISGIGLAIGYLLESSICLTLLCASTWLEKWSPKNPKLAKMLLASVSSAFFDNAAFFAFAIQAASIATLTRVDFGVSADGMGALTMQITWLVSMMTLLPLMLLVLRPGMFRDDENSATEDDREICERAKIMSRERTAAEAEARQDLRFFFLVVCWAMAFCPFFSRMGGTFGMLLLFTIE